MNTFEWTLNCTLLGWVLLRNLGTKPVNGRVLALPLVLVAVACAFYLRSIPTAGNDLALEVTGAVTGLVLGLAADRRHPGPGADGGQVVVSAGRSFAAIWIVAIGGRIAFASSPPTPGVRPSADSPSSTPSPAPTPGAPASS